VLLLKIIRLPLSALRRLFERYPMKSTISWLMVLAIFCLDRPSYSRETSAHRETLSPLYLYTSGSGTITPYQDEQMLEPGKIYQLTAVPAPGFRFASWQPVNVYVMTSKIVDTLGGESLTNVSVSTDTALLPVYSLRPPLRFTMQAPALLYATAVTNGNSVAISILTLSRGWQANFVPRSSQHPPH
jgi:hypothetical protein